MFRRILYTLILQLIFKCIRTLIIKQYLVVVYMLLSYLIMREGHKVICKTATVKKMEKNAECAVKLLLVSYKNLFSEDENRFDSTYAYLDLPLHSRWHLDNLSYLTYSFQ